MAQQADVDKMAQAITDAVNALVKKAVEEAKTHSIKVSVTNSEGVASGMYAMDDAIVTKQDDGTYLVKMHQASENRNYMALVNGTTADDIAAATQHKIDWYVADSSYYYTIPVASLSDTVYASFSKTTNVNKGSKWSNVQTITFDTTSMADTDKNDVDASGMNKQAALDYSSVDAALATVPEDLSIYTDETANAVTSAVKALSGTYKAATQDDVDKLATAITDAVNALVERGLLTVTNETLMFNVEKAILRDGNLILTLHGTGYHYLYKGTYEEAVANGDNRDNWIAGEEVNGKWQFTVPVAEGETHLPIVAISNSYLTKYEEGKNSLERAFYPRQAVIDQDAATLVTGDYDHTKDLTVDNSVKMFNVAAASLETIGGPNSNNYKEILHLTMGSDSFDKVFIGFAKDAAKAETTADITDRKVSFDMKANAMGGAATTDYLDKEVIFSFHSVKNGTWYERVFNVSKANGTLTITPVAAADYTAVDAALAAVPKDLSIYTDETVAAVRAAVDAVNKNCTVYQQADVDKMASDITAAVKALVKKPVAAAKVTLNATSKKITTGKSFTLKATVAPSNTTDKVVWKSSNTKVATVSANGKSSESRYCCDHRYGRKSKSNMQSYCCQPSLQSNQHQTCSCSFPLHHSRQKSTAQSYNHSFQCNKQSSNLEIQQYQNRNCQLYRYCNLQQKCRRQKSHHHSYCKRWQQEICKNHPCLHERFCKEHQAFRKNYRYQRSVHKSNRSRYFSGRKRKQITCMVFQQYKTCYR